MSDINITIVIYTNQQTFDLNDKIKYNSKLNLLKIIKGKKIKYK